MNYAVILSGGVGLRMRADGFPKQYILVKGKPVIIYTLEQFQKSPDIDRIIIVAAPAWQDSLLDWVEAYGITKFGAFADAGINRQESIWHGLEVCAKYSLVPEDNVVIHDGVRPLVSTELIAGILAQMPDHEGCMPIVPVKDTVYQSMDSEHISCLLERSTIFGGQTPEAFRLIPYLRIHRESTPEELAATRGSTEIAYNHHLDIRLIPGDDRNFKLTTPADLERFEALVATPQAK